MEIKSAVITGATGMIGVALTKYLIEKKINVLAVIRPNSKRRDALPKSPFVEVMECDLDDILLVSKKTKNKYDAFFHFAWDGTFGDSRNNMYVQTKNIKSTIDAVNLAHDLECKVFLGSGSQAEFGRTEKSLNEAIPTFPENGYGMAKLCAGRMSRVECQKYGIRHVWTRILSIYGPHDGKQTMITSCINKLLNKEKPSFTKGEQLWDYLYIDDAVDALFKAASLGTDGKTYCIGSGKVRRLSEYITIIRDQIDQALPLGIGEVPYAKNQVMHLCADISDLTNDTGFVPSISFEEGIKRTIAFELSDK